MGAFPEYIDVDWRLKVYLDGIMKECSLWFDDIQMINENKFNEKELLTLG